MGKLLTIILLFNIAFASAQEFNYPTIQKKGDSVAAFIPQGWQIIDSVRGDLNTDKQEDFAIVLQRTDSVMITKKADGFVDTVITQPRILIILFKERSSEQYKLMAQNNSFILTNDDLSYPSLDPYDHEMEIMKGVLTIQFRMHTGGGLTSGGCVYTFRYQHNNFVLIGADYVEVDHPSYDHKIYSFNFLTERWCLTEGNYMEDVKKKTTIKWHTFYVPVLKTLTSMKEPYSWEIIKGIFI